MNNRPSFTSDHKWDNWVPIEDRIRDSKVLGFYVSAKYPAAVFVDKTRSADILFFYLSIVKNKLTLVCMDNEYQRLNLTNNDKFGVLEQADIVELLLHGKGPTVINEDAEKYIALFDTNVHESLNAVKVIRLKGDKNAGIPLGSIVEENKIYVLRYFVGVVKSNDNVYVLVPYHETLEEDGRPMTILNISCYKLDMNSGYLIQDDKALKVIGKATGMSLRKTLTYILSTDTENTSVKIADAALEHYIESELPLVTKISIHASEKYNRFMVSEAEYEAKGF